MWRWACYSLGISEESIALAVKIAREACEKEIAKSTAKNSIPKAA